MRQRENPINMGRIDFYREILFRLLSTHTHREKPTTKQFKELTKFILVIFVWHFGIFQMILRKYAKIASNVGLREVLARKVVFSPQDPYRISLYQSQDLREYLSNQIKKDYNTFYSECFVIVILLKQRKQWSIGS